MFHAAIAGTGRAVPAKLLTNADLEKLVETSDEWITTRTGVRERHMAADGETLSDFCVEAGKQALDSAGRPREGPRRRPHRHRHARPADPGRGLPRPAEAGCEEGRRVGPERRLLRLALRPPHRRRPHPGGEGEEHPPRRRRVPDALHRLHRPCHVRPLRRRRRRHAPARDEVRPGRPRLDDPERRRRSLLHPDAGRGLLEPAEPAGDARAAPPVHQDDGRRDVQDRRPVDGRRLQGRPQRERVRAGRGLLARSRTRRTTGSSRPSASGSGCRGSAAS